MKSDAIGYEEISKIGKIFLGLVLKSKNKWTFFRIISFFSNNDVQTL